MSRLLYGPTEEIVEIGGRKSRIEYKATDEIRSSTNCDRNDRSRVRCRVIRKLPEAILSNDVIII